MRPVEPLGSAANDTVRITACDCSRQGPRTARVGGKCEAFQNVSVRLSGVRRSSGATPNSGSSRPSATATRPSTLIRCVSTPATVVLRLTRSSPSYQRSRMGACHSESPMSWSRASRRAVSASYGAAHSGTGMRGGRRVRQPSRTRERSIGSRSRLSSECSRPTASRSRSASSAHGPQPPRCSSTATLSSAEHAASAHAPRRDLRTRCSRTSGSGTWFGSGRPVSSTDERGVGIRALAAASERPVASGSPEPSRLAGLSGCSALPKGSRPLTAPSRVREIPAGCRRRRCRAPWTGAGGRGAGGGAPRPR